MKTSKGLSVMLRGSTILIAIILAVACLFSGLALAQENAPALEALFEACGNHPAVLFDRISDLTALPAKTCVLFDHDKMTALYDGNLTDVQDPTQAQALLLISESKHEGEESTYAFRVALPDASYCVQIISGVALADADALDAYLRDNFTFEAKSFDLLSQIAAYEQKLMNRDYLTAINACKDQYDRVKELGNVDAQRIGEPMVYMKDEDFVCVHPGGSPITFPPAEKKQYVPSSWSNPYRRPEITGKVSLGIAKLGQLSDGSISSYTVAGVERLMTMDSDCFCFSEVVGKDVYGKFTNKTTGDVVEANSYQMRVSVISLAGELLGVVTVTYVKEQSDPLGLQSQMIGYTLSRDKTGTVVFPWGYKTSFLKELEK